LLQRLHKTAGAMKIITFTFINTTGGGQMNKMVQRFALVSLFIVTGLTAEAGFFQNSQPDSEKVKIRYLDPVFEKITIRKDIVYGVSVTEKGVGENLLLDVYLPEGDKQKKRPVIVWVHGGGFTFGNDKSQKYITEMASRFARKGYVCLSIDYRVRKSPRNDMKGTISDAMEDVRQGLEWLRKNRRWLRVDVSKVIVGGGSAGGILGSHLCLGTRPGGKNDKAGIIGFVNLWGSPGKDWGEISVDRSSPPTIMVHGTEDRLVAYQNAVDLAEKLNAAGVKNELVTIKGAGHTPFGHVDDFEKNITRFLFEVVNE
jgi:acetyl esterase/lipase